jgi:hypothetical protein
MIEPQEKQIYPPDARLVYSNKNLRRKKPWEEVTYTSHLLSGA